MRQHSLAAERIQRSDVPLWQLSCSVSDHFYMAHALLRSWSRVCRRHAGDGRPSHPAAWLPCEQWSNEVGVDYIARKTRLIYCNALRFAVFAVLLVYLMVPRI